jgi:hypothetical protein
MLVGDQGKKHYFCVGKRGNRETTEQTQRGARDESGANNYLSQAGDWYRIQIVQRIRSTRFYVQILVNK